MISIKRAYESPSKNDGFRILVDRLWPRGLSKEKIAMDFWLKDIAPSTELRKWFNHDPAKWSEFKRKYKEELKDKQELLNVITAHAKHGNVTLLYGAKDEQHNEAIVLLEYLNNQLRY